jgi:uncharacterized membrane protein
MALGAAREQRVGKAVSRLRGPGILLGIGLGGFVDGILFHQILQWHHLLSSRSDDPTDTVAGLETNTLADGLFHASHGSSLWWAFGCSGGARTNAAGRRAGRR